MHTETTATIVDNNDEQVSTSFADLYDLFEIIGKYVSYYFLTSYGLVLLN